MINKEIKYYDPILKIWRTKIITLKESKKIRKNKKRKKRKISKRFLKKINSLKRKKKEEEEKQKEQKRIELLIKNRVLQHEIIRHVS